MIFFGFFQRLAENGHWKDAFNAFSSAKALFEDSSIDAIDCAKEQAQMLLNQVRLSLHFHFIILIVLEIIF